MHYSRSQTADVINQVIKATLYVLFNIGFKEETALLEEALNDVRTKLFQEGTTDELVWRFFKLLVEVVRRLCQATGIAFPEPQDVHNTDSMVRECLNLWRVEWWSG